MSSKAQDALIKIANIETVRKKVARNLKYEQEATQEKKQDKIDRIEDKKKSVKYQENVEKAKYIDKIIAKESMAMQGKVNQIQSAIMKQQLRAIRERQIKD